MAADSPTPLFRASSATAPWTAREKPGPVATLPFLCIAELLAKFSDSSVLQVEVLLYFPHQVREHVVFVQTSSSPCMRCGYGVCKVGLRCNKLRLQILELFFIIVEVLHPNLQFVDQILLQAAILECRSQSSAQLFHLLLRTTAFHVRLQFHEASADPSACTRCQYQILDKLVRGEVGLWRFHRFSADRARQCISGGVFVLPSILGGAQALLAELVATLQLKRLLEGTEANRAFDVVSLNRLHSIQRPIVRHGVDMGKGRNNSETARATQQ